MKRILAIAAVCCLTFSLSSYAQEYVPTPVTVSKEKVKLNGKVYLSHVVLERQTIYGIIHAYGISENELYEANPTLQQTGLQKNAIILIPFKEGVSEAPKAESQPSGEFIEHKVKWFEDIDDIAKTYGVTVKEIMDFNGLKSRKLSTRQIIRIPLMSSLPAETKTNSTETEAEKESETKTESELFPLSPEDTTSHVGEPLAEQTEIIPEISGGHNVEAALLLPFNASGKLSDVNMDFYCGALLALRELEKNGVKAKLNVFDLYAGIPASGELGKCDFVLGPVSARDIEAILQRIDGDVPLISPLDHKAASLGENYRKFIQAPTAVDRQYIELVKWLSSEREESDRIILITEKNAKNSSSAIAIRNAMASENLNYEILNYAIVEGRGIPSIMNTKMNKDAVNRVVVASESEAFIGDVMRNLSIMMGKGYQIVMYAPSKVRTFETIEGSSYHQASLHLCSPYFVDYNDKAVNDFVLKYRALYNTEPSQFAFQGYDTVHFFTGLAFRYGKRWPKALELSREAGLHTDFLFAPSGKDGYSNTAVRRILYKKDYSTVIVR